jgi:hypothetical protein
MQRAARVLGGGGEGGEDPINESILALASSTVTPKIPVLTGNGPLVLCSILKTS